MHLDRHRPWGDRALIERAHRTRCRGAASRRFRVFGPKGPASLVKAPEAALETELRASVQGMLVDVQRRRTVLRNGLGGLSGPAVKPVALHAVYHAHAATGLPIIGMGGVAGAQDVSEFLAAGATLVGIGTALFRDPGVVGRASAELLVDLERRGVSGPGDLVAAAHPPTSTSSRA